MLAVWRNFGAPRAIAAIAVILCCLPAYAESTRLYDLEGFGHFLDGNPETTAVTEEGAVVLPPTTRERYASAAEVFSAAAADGDDLIVARAEDGQVLAIDSNGKTRKLFKPDETVVTALLVSGKDLFVATGSPGKIYRVGKDGKSELYYKSTADYVWALVRGPKNALFATTGEPGTVVRIDKKDTGKVVFAPEQEHLRALAYDSGLGLLVGGSEHGIVYQSSNATEFRAIYDTGHPEVTAIVARGNHVFAAAVTGAQELVEAGSGDKGDKAKSNVHSQIFRIAKDGSAEALAGSSDEAVFALSFDDKGRVLVATGATGRDDPRGRIYSVDADNRLVSLLHQSASRRITHLVALSHGQIAAVGAAGGRITEIAPGVAKKGEFFTLAFDTGINSRFGLAQVFGDVPKGTHLSVALRSGQTADPDSSWSAWSKEISAPGNVSAKIANGRYLQARLTLNGDGKVTPTAYRVRVAYVRDNLSPYVREVTAMAKGLALYSLPQEPSKSKTVNFNDKPVEERRRDDDDGPGSGRARQIEEQGALTIRWVAEDPNGDQLRYVLKYRREGQGAWQLLKGELDVPFFSMQASQFPDGRYQFRVEATDAPSNPRGEERSDARESRVVLVDNTPPALDAVKVRVEGRKVTARGSISDNLGPLVAATYSLDAKEPKPVRVEDGVLDGPSDAFVLNLGELPAGPHTLTVRARDEAQNEAVAEATFVIP